MTTDQEWIQIGNPNGVTVGEEVILDNRHTVKLINLSPRQIFATVQADGEQWEVMTSRLRKVVVSDDNQTE